MRRIAMFSGQLLTQPAFRLGAYLAIIGVITSLTGWSAYHLGTTIVGLLDAKIIDGSGRALPEPQWSAPPLASDPRTEDTAEAINAASGAVSQLTSASGGPLAPAPRTSSDDPEIDPTAMFHSGRGNTYKTYCVRLCDGFYWPISFSTTSDRFEADSATCNTTCGSPARLFVHPVPGGGPATMVSLEGLPYTALKSAFMFRVRYDAQCRCQPQPWEEAARDRHKLFAAAQAAGKGNATAIEEALRLKNKIAEDRREQTATQETAERIASVELARLVETTSLSPPERSRKQRRPEVQRDAAQRYETRRGEVRRAESRRESRAVRLGAYDSSPPPKSGSFVPASGAGRAWREKIFGDD